MLCYWRWAEFLSLSESAEHLWDYKNVSRTSIDIIVGRLFHFKSRKGTKVFYIRCFFFGGVVFFSLAHSEDKSGENHLQEN